MRMVTYTTVIGKMIKRMDLDSIRIRMGRSTKDIGSMISSMERGKSIGQMARNMKASTNTGRRTDTDSSCGLIGRVIMGILLIIIFTARARIRGPTAAYTTATGKTTKCMARACLRGLMVASMRASTTTTRSRGMEFFIGRMGGSTTASGWAENNKASASISMQKAK